MNVNIEKIKLQAEKEIKEEMFKKRVDEYKTKLKEKRNMWDRIFPYKLLIIKKEL